MDHSIAIKTHHTTPNEPTCDLRRARLQPELLGGDVLEEGSIGHVHRTRARLQQVIEEPGQLIASRRHEMLIWQIAENEERKIDELFDLFITGGLFGVR